MCSARMVALYYCEAPFALLQALIQYPDPVAANNAKTALEGHAIYDGGYNRVCVPSSPQNLHEQLVLSRYAFLLVSLQLRLHDMCSMPHTGQSGTVSTTTYLTSSCGDKRCASMKLCITKHVHEGLITSQCSSCFTQYTVYTAITKNAILCHTAAP